MGEGEASKEALIRIPASSNNNKNPYTQDQTA